MSKQPVFICGLNRTGTTTLGNLLDQSKEIHFIREAWLLPQLKNMLRHYKKLYNDCQNFTPWSARDVSVATFREHLSSFYYQVLMEASNGKRFVEKTPIWNVLQIKFLHSLFPQAYYILMYRDGRNQISSALKKAENRNVQLAFKTCCQRWAKSMDIFHEVKKNDILPRVHFVQYEKFFKNPYRTFKDVCRFVEIEPFNPYFPPPNTSYKTKKENGGTASRWESWSSEEKELFKEIAGKQLEQWNYPPKGPEKVEFKIKI